MTDPIADMIVRMKNARMAKHVTVRLPSSKLKLAIAEKLKQRGFVTKVATKGKKIEKEIELVFGRNEQGVYRFSDARRVSRPGCRVYVGAQHIRPVRGGQGFAVLSTPKGILFGDEARKAHVGGEVLFEIW